MSRRRGTTLLLWLALAGAVSISLGQVLSAAGRLSHTVDEPVHVAAGLEWWLDGTQRVHPENPPLGRIGAGLHAYRAGTELPPRGRAGIRGLEILYGTGDYSRELIGARLGTLPFYLLLLVVVGCWAGRLGGLLGAAIAVTATAGLPPLVAHASLATTDVPFAATLLLAIWRLSAWLDRPATSWRSDRWMATAVIAGLAAGSALATKFSTLLFLPAAAFALGILRWRRPGEADGSGRPPAKRLALEALLVALCAGLVLWGFYGFEFGRLADTVDVAPLLERAFADPGSGAYRFAALLTTLRLPAPGALHGLLFLAAHARIGHSAYLLGQVSQHGFWYFYPVALLFKTPLAFLLIGVAGSAAALYRGDRRHLAPAAAALAILLASFTSSINIGIRHVLVIYPLVAITAGAGLAFWIHGGLRRRRRTLAVATLAAALVAQTATCLASHPDQLAYFNPLAGSEPGRILVDSDLDWGQSLFELSARLRELGVSHLHLAYFGSASLCGHDLPEVTWLPPNRPVEGWVAVSEMYYRGQWRWTYDAVCPRRGARYFEERDGYAWLEAYEPVERVGGSIRLYRIPGR